MLIETVVAVTVFVTLATAAFVGISTLQRVRLRTERQAVAENIARNQFEYIFSLDYIPPTTPYPVTTTPAGFTASTTVGFVGLFTEDTNVEKITVTVSEGGEEITSIETFRLRD